MKWTVGMITCPRKDGHSYIDQSLESLTKAGFSVTVFAEPGSFVPEGANVIQRKKQYGDWTNWITGFYELLVSEYDSDYFMMVEDDAIICKDSKRYLEYAIPQLGEFASLSLYTPSIYHKKNFRGFHNQLEGHRTWSTVTVVMTRQKAIDFFSDPHVQKHRFEDIFGFENGYWQCPNTDPKNSIKDAVIGQWANKKGLAIYFHTPSLAEHIGDFSTLTDQESTVANGRRSLDFIGIEADLESWTKEPIAVRRHTKVLLS